MWDDFTVLRLEMWSNINHLTTMVAQIAQRISQDPPLGNEEGHQQKLYRSSQAKIGDNSGNGERFCSYEG